MATAPQSPVPTPPGFHAWLAALTGVIAILVLLFVLTGLSGAR
jgi:hypothetical protein